ncbi:hypothetical protein AVEN_150937-1 [Araneus ventricosus]|uniref:Secreted protein n=1 Tax=Araneus ventricosus TaxID=182803 RepID=A0A4Y2BKP2_ARAVE|nr:hypothetical protein AVEN_150937-1 [Araneus ventricosus]
MEFQPWQAVWLISIDFYSFSVLAFQNIQFACEVNGRLKSSGRTMMRRSTPPRKTFLVHAYSASLVTIHRSICEMHVSQFCVCVFTNNLSDRISNAGFLRERCAVQLPYNAIYSMNKAFSTLRCLVILTRLYVTYPTLTFVGVVQSATL